MIICDFDSISIAILKDKTYAPLLVYRYGVLPRPIILQSMKPVTGGDFQIIKCSRIIQKFQTPQGSLNNIRWQAPGTPGQIDSFGMLVGKCFDHDANNVMRNVTAVKRDNMILLLTSFDWEKRKIPDGYYVRVDCNYSGCN